MLMRHRKRVLRSFEVQISVYSMVFLAVPLSALVGIW